jgi:hypothetical protein
VGCIEHEEDVYPSTLRTFVEELGGKLELSAVFPEGRVALAAKQSSCQNRSPPDPRYRRGSTSASSDAQYVST